MLDSPVGKYSAFALHEVDPDSISSIPHSCVPPPTRNAGCDYCECGAKGKHTDTHGFDLWNPIWSSPTASLRVIRLSAESRVTFEHRVARGRTQIRKPSRGSESFSQTTHQQDKKEPEQEGAGPETDGRDRKPKEANPEVGGGTGSHAPPRSTRVRGPTGRRQPGPRRPPTFSGPYMSSPYSFSRL